MIPKVLYYVWIGGNPKPDIFYHCLESWIRYLPEYEIVEINESNFNLDYHLAHNSFFRTCYERKMWAFVSDYMRIVYLYENGGIYLDTDMEITKDFSQLIDERTEFFAGFEDKHIVNAAIFGAKKNSPILENIINFYNKDIWRSPLFTIPSIMTYILNNYLSLNHKLSDSYFGDQIKLFPKHHFYPYSFSEKFSPECLTNETYGIHWWNHSWNNTNDYVFLKTKNLTGLHKLTMSFAVKLKRELQKAISNYAS